MTAIPHQLDLTCLAQPHEDKDWRGNFRHEYALQVGIPMEGNGMDAAGNTHVLSLHVVAVPPVPHALSPSAQLPVVRAAPSIALLIKSLRKPVYPGDDETYCWPITHVAERRNFYMQRFGEQPSQVLGTIWAPTITPRVSTYQQQHSLPAAQFRLAHFFVKLDAESRLKLNVWLDAMYTEGVLQ